MKLNHYIFGVFAALSLASCSDKMDYHEYKVDGSDYIKEMFSRVGGLATTIYQNLDSDFGNYSGAMLSSATDELLSTSQARKVRLWSPSASAGRL